MNGGLKEAVKPMSRKDERNISRPPVGNTGVQRPPLAVALTRMYGRNHRPKALDILPTLEDTRRHQQKQGEDRRKKIRRERPPCPRCCVRKRAEMQREKGRVDEQAFERWAKTPRGFMNVEVAIAAGSGRCG